MNSSVLRSPRIVALAVLTVGTGVLVAPPQAAAGEFSINACQADRGSFSTAAFEDFATRGMRWKRACDPTGKGLRGLVTSNVLRGGKVPRGSRAILSLRAPAGTRFVRFRWSGQARRRDCRYALQLYADRPDGPPVTIKNVRANRDCPDPDRTQSAGWPRPRDYDVTGATRIIQRVVCVGEGGGSCSSRSLNYIRTFTAKATVADVSSPTVGVVADSPFTRGEWVNGTQAVAYDAVDNIGVRLARATIANVPRGEHPRPCNYALRVPCPSGPGHVGVDTRSLDEGSQSLVVQAEDAAGNVGASAPVTVRVDNTAPGAVPVALDGGEAWRNQNDFDVVWENPPEGDRAPIIGARYGLCRTGTAECVDGARAAVGIDRIVDFAVPAPGEWQFRMYREDAATNAQPGNASVPVNLRYDPEPPQLGFEQASASDPTQVSVLVTDRVSGLAGGQIEISAQGSGSWRGLDTRQDGARLVARIDDAQLPPGNYALRAVAHDQASNHGTSDRRLDGSPMIVTLPLRIPTTMRVGVAKKKLVQRRIRRHGKRRTGRRRATVLKPSARVGFGRRVRIAGRLSNSDGQGLGRAAVQVLSRTPTTAERLVAVLRTDARGRYRYLARASTTRTLRFVYEGAPQILPVVREVRLLVGASSTFGVSRRRALNGQAVSFTGRLRALPTPSAGKLVELQVRLSRSWQTFRTTKSGTGGRWRVRYRFKRVCGVQRFQFRARLPKEAGYPFETGRSRVTAVTVRGRPCR